jgi:hypothetical protein
MHTPIAIVEKPCLCLSHAAFLADSVDALLVTTRMKESNAQI